MLYAIIEPVVVQKSPVIAQRVTIVQPLVRPVLGRHVQGERGRPLLLAAYCNRNPYSAESGERGMPRVKGAGQYSQLVRMLFIYVVGVPRERTWQNEPSRHDTTADTLRASETTRALSRVQRLCTLSISRVSTKATSDPYPSLSHVYHIGTCARTSQAPQPGD